MKYNFLYEPEFLKAVKALAQRYPSLKSDLQEFRCSLEQNPEQGVDLGNGVRKIRMTIKSKGRGKSGGARVITCNIMVSCSEMNIAFLYIYDKADTSSIKNEAIIQIRKNLGV